MTTNDPAGIRHPHVRLHVDLEPASVQDAMRCIAARICGVSTRRGAGDDAPNSRLGQVTLRPHQLDALSRIRAIVREFGGALLADDVGLGKTYVALACARAYERAHILAPAALLPMWRDAIRASGLRHPLLHSLHRVSQRSDALLLGNDRQRMLVVVDEAHHLRTPHTLRYRRVAEFCAGHDVLLLSATPVHNREEELRTMLALFMGSRSDLLDRNILERVVVRRMRGAVSGTVGARGAGERATPAAGLRIPAIVEETPVSVPFDEETLRRILSLPDPLPARGGASAGALIRLGLLRAWCSSDAALAHAIRVRRLRGEALAHALRNGRYPTRDELRTWVVGDQSVQLGFAEFLSQPTHDHRPLLERLAAHLDAMAELQVHHARCSDAADVSRAEALRRVRSQYPERPVVAFSQYTETVRRLYRALADIAGVASIAGRVSRIASGPTTRRDVLERFAPHSHGRPPPAAHDRVMLLLTTDLLAEGVNLQDAGVVVHLDLPWTDAVRRQRVGRCARIGARFDPLIVHTFAPPPGIDVTLRIAQRLARKAQVARELVGSDVASAPSPAEQASALRELLTSWSTDPMTAQADLAPPESPLAFGRGAIAGWMAVIENHCGTRTLAHMRGRTSDSTTHVLEFVRSLEGEDHGPTDPDLRQLTYEDAYRQIEAWVAKQEVTRVLGPPPRAISVTQTRVVARIAEVVGSLSPARRALVSGSAGIAEGVARTAKGVGAEKALSRWLASWTPDCDPTQWLYGWKAEAALERTGRAVARFSPVPLDVEWRVIALIVVPPRIH